MSTASEVPRLRLGQAATTGILQLTRSASPKRRRYGLLVGEQAPVGELRVERVVALERRVDRDASVLLHAVRSAGREIYVKGSRTRILGWVVAGRGHGLELDPRLMRLHDRMFGHEPGLLLVTDADREQACTYRIADHDARRISESALDPLGSAAYAAAVALLIGCGVLAGALARLVGIG